MANMRKVTVTLPTASVETIRAMKEQGQVDSVGQFVQHAVQTSLDDIAGWAAMLDQALKETGGPLTAEEREWASKALGLKATV